MRESLKSGLSFGTTTGIITTLGLIAGLNAGTHSALAVMGGILSIAVADGMAEAMGMHISKKSESKLGSYVWESTLAILLAKFLVTVTFIAPILVLPDLRTAIIADVVWGLLLLALLSYLVSPYERKDRWKDILEHVLVAVLVVALTTYAGGWIHSVFS